MDSDKLPDCIVCDGNGFLIISTKNWLSADKEDKEIMCENCKGNGFVIKEELCQ